ncbi:MAG: ABC transporter substrate-binding protein [Proteobacteria bacterium]|nr:MAG: ABC transporter substrate-binding protein [Pseudomonadota bacterium]
MIVDAASLPRAPARIVSLVPSLTESLFALGLGARVVGVTDWCVHPADEVESLPKVGGTKDADVAAIAALAPDLVIANHEENTRRVVEKLDAAGLAVWVTYPRTVREGAVLLRELAALGATREAVAAVVEPVEAAIAEAERSLPAHRTRVFCPIWRDPWMSVGRDTYVHSLLELCGGDNVTADRGDRRYPLVTLDDVVVAAPEVILLPDEPYAFGPADVAELGRLGVPAARDGRIHCVDGTWVSWYGPRIRTALVRIRSLLDPGRRSQSGARVTPLRFPTP